MAISTISQAGLNAPLSLTSPAFAGTPTGVGVLTSGTAVASTSGTSIDFTGIPSWVKRVTVMFNGVSTSGTSNIQIQIGAGSVTTTGYVSGAMSTPNVGFPVITGNVSTGFLCTATTAAANTRSGLILFSNVTGNTWVSSGNLSQNDNNFNSNAGTIALGGTLDRVRVTTVNGTDTFDAGSINILYE